MLQTMAVSGGRLPQQIDEIAFLAALAFSRFRYGCQNAVILSEL